MNYLSIENLSKSYGDKILFEGLNFGMFKGEKTALVANNGAGKTSLLKILSGRESADTGKVTIRQGIKLAMLDQEPELDESLTIDELIKTASSSISKVILEYEQALENHNNNHNAESQRKLDIAFSEMDHKNAWDYERRLKQLLSLFKITDTNKKIKVLSGGEKKRLALAIVLLDEPDLLILDEPTNHLDINMIEWLEKYLSKASMTLLMVTHDRYFLDRVCNHILEMQNGQLFYHNGNYEYFISKRMEREETRQTETDKARQLMKKELDWLRRMPKARTHKSKSRIQAFDGIKEKATGQKTEQELKLQVQAKRLGGKILELENLNKSYSDIQIVKNFSYLFKKGERIGIIGPNGSGKTSFLNLITGIEIPDSGKVETGQTVLFGYYKQASLQPLEDKRVIDIAKDIAEVVRMGNGNSISASKFLEYFMFPPETQYKLVSKLSGGEKRRLSLLTVLIKSPNFLILDEPTNDLDLLVLNQLEEFLLNFDGCLILVSHDRYFLDKLTDHLFIFEGNGKIKDYYGTYSQYHFQNEKNNRTEVEKKQAEEKSIKEKPKLKTKLSFNEKREYESLEIEIDQLDKEKIEIEAALNSGNQNYDELNKLSKRIGEIIELIDVKTLRWMELDDFV